MNDEYSMITPDLLKFLRDNTRYDISIMYDAEMNSYRIGIHDYRTNYGSEKYIDVPNVSIADAIPVEEVIEFAIKFYTDKLKRDFSGSV